MKKSETREKVSEFVIEYIQDHVFTGPTDDKVTEESRFVEDLGGDSLDVVEVIIELEHEYDINISDEECDALCHEGAKVSEIIDFTMKKIKERDGRR